MLKLLDTSILHNGTEFQSAPTSSFKNRIINGDMRVDQRLGGNIYSYVQYATGSFATYGAVDRWMTFTGGTYANVKSQQISVDFSGAPFKTALKISEVGNGVHSGGGAMALIHRIEDTNICDLVGKKLTLSFYHAWINVPSGSSANLIVKLATPTSGRPNDYGTYDTNTSNFPHQVTTFYTNTLTAPILQSPCYYTIEIASLPKEAVNGLEITFESSQYDGSNHSWWLSGVQLEAGAAASPYEILPYNTQLELCQRYCYAFGGKPNGPTFLPGDFWYSGYTGQAAQPGSGGGSYAPTGSDLIYPNWNIRFPIPLRSDEWTLSTYTSGGSSVNFSASWSTNGTNFQGIAYYGIFLNICTPAYKSRYWADLYLTANSGYNFGNRRIVQAPATSLTLEYQTYPNPAANYWTVSFMSEL